MYRREVQRGLAALRPRGPARARLHQHRRQLLVVLLDRHVQRGLALLVLRVQVDAAAQDDAFGDQGLGFVQGFEEALFGGGGLDEGEERGEEEDGEKAGHGRILAIWE